MALVDDIDPKSEFRKYLTGKPSSARDVFYEKANVDLWVKESRLNRKGRFDDTVNESFHSNVATKKSGESSGKFQVNVRNQNKKNDNSHKNGGGGKRNQKVNA